MPKHFSAFVASMLCTFVSTLAIAQEDESYRPKAYRPTVGEVHPDFVLPNIETGEATWLSQFRGKKVLLIHFASW